MKIFFRLVFLLILFISASAQKSYSQKIFANQKPSKTDLFQEIEKDFKKGSLSVDQKVLYKFYAISDRDKLPSGYGIPQTKIIKCGTPAIIDFYRNRSKLSDQTVKKIESLISTPSTKASETYRSASGKFLIHYDTSGDDAVPSKDENQNGTPDYVEEVAAAADSSYSHEVRNIGYVNPIPDGETYHVDIDNLETYYGETISPGNYGGDTSIRIENDFSENFPPNDDPEGDMIGAIKVTMAHEMKHAINYANSEWVLGFNWSEMDATLMEEVVYDNVNDYYNYLRSNDSIFNSPASGIPGAYWQVTWSLFFEEYFGSRFWVDVWDYIDQSPNTPFLTAIKKQVSARFIGFNSLFAESFLWHLAAGPRLSAPSYGFEERKNYPAPSITKSINGIQQEAGTPYSISTLGSRFFEIEPLGMEQNQVQITFTADTTHFTAGAIAYFSDGSSEQVFQSSVNEKGDIVLKTPWSWKDISRIGVVVANTSRSNNLNVGISTDSYDAKFVTMEQNFPNPFNGDTIIRFFLLREMPVSLKIYDTSGRLVKTLLDENMTAGPHEIPFSSRGLASGIYFYQLNTDRKTLSRKMTIIH